MPDYFDPLCNIDSRCPLNLALTVRSRKFYFSKTMALLHLTELKLTMNGVGGALWFIEFGVIVCGIARIGVRGEGSEREDGSNAADESFHVPNTPEKWTKGGETRGNNGAVGF